MRALFRPSARRPVLVAVAGALVVGAAFSASVGGAAPGAVEATAPTSTVLPTVTGTAQQGQTVSALPGTWTGDQPIAFAFRWQSCTTEGSCADIPGATSQSYVVGAADVSRTLRVLVAATNPAGSSSAASAPTGVVVPTGSVPAAGRQPDPSGSAVVGGVVTVDDASWSGSAPIALAYQWQRCATAGSCGDIPGATGKSYTAQPADAGFRLRAIVRATNAVGSTSVASNLTAVVASASGAPVATTAPAVSGRAEVGQTLAGTVGTWVGAQPISFSFSWSRCDANARGCQAIPGATGATYRVALADVGGRLQFAVRAANGVGATVAGAAPTAAVAQGALPAGAMQIPDGKVSIPVASVSSPERLVVSGIQFSPSPVRTIGSITARFRITDTRGYVVRDALVYAIGLPYTWFGNAREVATGADGWAVATIVPTAKLPVGKRGAAVFFVRARKPGGSLLSGISTRRLVQVRLG